MTLRARRRKERAEALESLAGDEEQLLSKPTSVWRNAGRRLLRRKTGLVGIILVGGIVLTAVFAPLIAPYDPNEVLIGKEDITKRESPCVHLLGCDRSEPQHIMGVDGNVRDEFSRVIYGSRVSVVVGFSVVLMAVSVGAALGAVAGFWGGTSRLGSFADNAIMRVMDVLLGFPSFLLAIAIVAALGPGIRNALIGVAIVSIPVYARIMRASVLSIRELDYVAASRALGASGLRILWTRVLPNALTPLVVVGTLGVATAILDIAGLSFLGLGAQPPTAEWGSMLSSERNQIFSAPHLVFFPGLAIMITVLGFNLLGDGLRDALDPALHD